MNSISKWLWLVGSLTVVNKFFWKKNLVDFFLKTHTSYLQLSFLSYAKILFEHGCFDKQTDPLVKVPFFACHPKHGVELLERIWWKYWGFIQNMPNHISTSSFFNTRAYFLSSLHPCGTSRAFRIQNYCTTFLCLF